MILATQVGCHFGASDHPAREQMFADKTVLITGGTGSFGQTMARHLLAAGCRSIRIFSRDEAKQDDMRRRFSDPSLSFFLGDVRDIDSITQAIQGANLIFHAAALKQVPSCEFFPMQAVLTNVVGSYNVITQATRHNADAIVLLSTDKAVYPVNAMGMTKALMEKLAQAAARTLESSTPVLSSVRYGNVMHSRGSVIPLFVEQIQACKEITVTDPEMTRFMLPLDKAVELVLFALKHARQGDTFIRKAPACTMGDLALALKSLFAAANEIKVIGIRHGEKLFETLATCEELRRAEDMGAFLRLPVDERSLNYDTYFSQGEYNDAAADDYTSHNTERLSVDQVKGLLLSLPELQDALATRLESVGRTMPSAAPGEGRNAVNRTKT